MHPLSDLLGNPAHSSTTPQRYGRRKPVAVHEALNDPLLRGQGFLPRFLFASAESIAGTRFLTHERLAAKSYEDPRLQRFWQRCREIMASKQFINTDTAEVSPPVLELTNQALGVWMDWYNTIEGEQSALGEFGALRPFAGRAGELARRVAAVFACFGGQDQIDAECMQRACEIVEHSLSEWARHAEGGAAEAETAQASDLMDWLRANNWEHFDARRLQREGPRFVRKSAKLRDKVLGLLVDYRHLLSYDGKRFFINPLATTATTATARGPQPTLQAGFIRPMLLRDYY